jgi:hypothetical protein
MREYACMNVNRADFGLDPESYLKGITRKVAKLK